MSESQARLLLLSGLGDQVARKIALDEDKEGQLEQMTLPT